MSTKMTPQLRFPEFIDEWQAKKLGDIAVKVSDRNNATSASTVLTNSAVHGVIPQTDFFDKEIAVQGNLSNYYKTELDDFVYNPRISTSAPVGPFKRNNYGSGVLSPLYNLYRFRGGQVLTFFEQYLKSIHWHKYMKDVANYGARSDRMAISSADLLALPLPYPSKSEQEKIADFMTAVDERIGVSEKKLELLETYKRGVMQRIFSQQIRFKDENGEDYPEWEEKQLGSLVEIKKGTQLNGDTLTKDGNYPMLNGGMSPSGFTDSYNSDANTVTISEGGNSCGYVSYMSEKFWSGGHLYTLVDLKIDDKFVYQLLKFKQDEIMRLRVGSGLPNIQKGDLAKLRLYIPKLNEQQKIATFLTTLDEKITAEKSKLTATRQFKKALLQRMFV